MSEEWLGFRAGEGSLPAQCSHCYSELPAEFSGHAIVVHLECRVSFRDERDLRCCDIIAAALSHRSRCALSTRYLLVEEPGARCSGTEDWGGVQTAQVAQ